MKSLGLAVFFVALAVANAGLHGLVGQAVIKGPSGAIISNGVSPGGIVAGAPGIYGAGYGLGAAGAAGAIIVPPTATGAVVAPGLGLAGHGLGLLGAGSGLEGQYIHDHSELLYDDGSYKPYLYGH